MIAELLVRLLILVLELKEVPIGYWVGALFCSSVLLLIILVLIVKLRQKPPTNNSSKKKRSRLRLIIKLDWLR